MTSNLVDALVYTLERPVSAYEGYELLAVLRTRRGTELAVADYWARPGFGDHRLVVRAWRLGASVAGARFIFRGDRDDWTDGLGDGPRWTELDQ